MKKLHFPHISRLFSANKSIPFTLMLCWSVLTACIIVNIKTSSIYESVTAGVEEMMTKTADATVNRQVSDWFEKSGIHDVAGEVRRSVDSALTKPAAPPLGNTVLGSQTHTFEYWNGILSERPDYRDAYLAAAKIALSQNNNEEALRLVKRTLEIDPNNSTAIVLKTLLEKNLSK
jgi:hypothetical protein